MWIYSLNSNFRFKRTYTPFSKQVPWCVLGVLWTGPGEGVYFGYILSWYSTFMKYFTKETHSDRRRSLWWIHHVISWPFVPCFWRAVSEQTWVILLLLSVRDETKEIESKIHSVWKPTCQNSKHMITHGMHFSLSNTIATYVSFDSNRSVISPE